jgi:hypothetical protein
MQQRRRTAAVLLSAATLLAPDPKKAPPTMEAIPKEETALVPPSAQPKYQNAALAELATAIDRAGVEVEALRTKPDLTDEELRLLKLFGETPAGFAVGTADANGIGMPTASGCIQPCWGIGGWFGNLTEPGKKDKSGGGGGGGGDKSDGGGDKSGGGGGCCGSCCGSCAAKVKGGKGKGGQSGLVSFQDSFMKIMNGKDTPAMGGAYGPLNSLCTSPESWNGETPVWKDSAEKQTISQCLLGCNFLPQLYMKKGAKCYGPPFYCLVCPTAAAQTPNPKVAKAYPGLVPIPDVYKCLGMIPCCGSKYVPFAPYAPWDDWPVCCTNGCVLVHSGVNCCNGKCCTLLCPKCPKCKCPKCKCPKCPKCPTCPKCPKCPLVPVCPKIACPGCPAIKLP